MTGQEPRSQRESLQDSWSRWTSIVASFARRRPARRRVDPRAYATLRQDLIAACRSLAETDDERRSYYTALEEMVRPWLSPRVLARTDREILTTLLSHCRQVERQLGGRRWRLEWPFPLAPAPMIAVGAAGLACAWALRGIVPPVLAVLRDAADTLWLTIRFADDQRMGSVLAVIIIVGAMYIVSRIRTS